MFERLQRKTNGIHRSTEINIYCVHDIKSRMKPTMLICVLEQGKRIPKTEDRIPKTEDRRPKTEDRRPNTKDSIRKRHKEKTKMMKETGKIA